MLCNSGEYSRSYVVNLRPAGQVLPTISFPCGPRGKYSPRSLPHAARGASTAHDLFPMRPAGQVLPTISSPCGPRAKYCPRSLPHAARGPSTAHDLIPMRPEGQVLPTISSPCGSWRFVRIFIRCGPQDFSRKLVGYSDPMQIQQGQSAVIFSQSMAVECFGS